MSLITSSNIQITLAVRDGIAPITIQQSYQRTLSSGTSSSQSDVSHAARYAITTTTTTLDLAGGTMVQPDTSAASFASLTELLVVNNSTTATVTVGGGANAVSGVSRAIGPGGVLYLRENTAPITVTAGTGDLLRLVASAGSANVDVYLVGRSV